MYNDERANAVNRQRDLVLAINEFCFLQNKTNGSIKSHVGSAYHDNFTAGGISNF